nr:G protein-coupled receptor [Proales similis]
MLARPRASLSSSKLLTGLALLFCLTGVTFAMANDHEPTSVSLVNQTEMAVGQTINSVTGGMDAINSSSEQMNLNDSRSFLEMALGPRRKPLTFIVFMSTVYGLILIAGLLGNISTCFVVICNNCMHNTTNYYLFSLAVSDVLSLLSGLPPELYSIIVEAYPWPFGSTFCTLRTYVFETTTIASVLTILTFTFERWLHICKAIYAKKFSSGLSRALKIIAFIWLSSGTLALPYLFTTGVYYEYPAYAESKTCSILSKHKLVMTRVIQLSVVFLFIVPMTLISIMYVLIGVTLWKSSSRNYHQHSSVTSEKRSGASRRAPLLKSISNLRQTSKNETSEHMLSNVNLHKTASGHGGFLQVGEPFRSGRLHRATSDVSMMDDATSMNINTSMDRASRDFEPTSYRARQSRRDVVKMLFVVVLAFFICWAPYHFQRVVAVTAGIHSSVYKSKFMMRLFEYLYYISGVSIYISSTLNPILYNVMSKRYRQAFKNTIRMVMSCSFKSRSSHAYRNSTLYYNTVNSRKALNSKRVET